MIRLIVAGLLLGAWAASAASPVFAQHVEAGAARAVEQPAPRAQPVYSVVLYDPARDPAVDLAQTIEQAEAGDKRILLEVGGAWCTWCHALERFLHEREAVAWALPEWSLSRRARPWGCCSTESTGTSARWLFLSQSGGARALAETCSTH